MVTPDVVSIVKTVWVLGILGIMLCMNCKLALNYVRGAAIIGSRPNFPRQC